MHQWKVLTVDAAMVSVLYDRLRELEREGWDIFSVQDLGRGFFRVVVRRPEYEGGS